MHRQENRDGKTLKPMAARRAAETTTAIFLFLVKEQLFPTLQGSDVLINMLKTSLAGQFELKNKSMKLSPVPTPLRRRPPQKPYVSNWQ
jgi:hypothetical protein